LFGALILSHHLGERYLRYFVALGAGVQLAAAPGVIPGAFVFLSVDPALVLAGYCRIHLLESHHHSALSFSAKRSSYTSLLCVTQSKHQQSRGRRLVGLRCLMVERCPALWLSTWLGLDHLHRPSGLHKAAGGFSCSLVMLRRRAAARHSPQASCPPATCLAGCWSSTFFLMGSAGLPLAP